MNLLTAQNAKTTKGEKLGYLTGILYMIPNYKICPSSELAGCDKFCLVTAGRGKFSNVVAGRQRKTDLFANDKKAFFSALVKDILALERKAKREGLIPCVRLNGTSDINYNKTPLTYDGVNYDNIFSVFPHIQFYDYTKNLSIARASLKQDNHHVTFSYSAKPEYQGIVSKALKMPLNMSVVFNGKDLPGDFLGKEVINADLHDLRFLDKPNTISGLYAKGDAKKDTSNIFVVNI